MGLKIILGTKDFDKWEQYFLKQGIEYMDDNDVLFNTMYTPDWADDEFIRRAIMKINSVDRIVEGVAFHNSVLNEFFCFKELATGSKTVILVYKFPDLLLRARMGKNCAIFIEEIASKRDVVIHSFDIVPYEFKYIDKIEIVNYGKTVTSYTELCAVYCNFMDYERTRLQEGT